MKREYMSCNVYEATQQRLRLIFEEFDNIYVSFSGGKAGIDGDDSYHLKEIPFFPGYSLAVCCKRPVGEVKPEEVRAKDW